MSWVFNQDYWELNHKCTFDGVNKLIIVGTNTSILSIKIDVYSDWKEWIQLRDNAKFLPAIRVTGGDTIGGGEFTGDIYFLTNGWQLVIDHSCTVNGVLYSDDFSTPFVTVDGVNIVTNRVSSLVNSIETGGGGGGGATPAQIWSYGTRTLTSASGPTAVEIADQVRVELTPELDYIFQIPTSGGGFTSMQATMLLEMYNILGLDPTRPLIVTKTTRDAGPEIHQTINTVENVQSTVTRVP